MKLKKKNLLFATISVMTLAGVSGSLVNLKQNMINKELQLENKNQISENNIRAVSNDVFIDEYFSSMVRKFSSRVLTGNKLEVEGNGDITSRVDFIKDRGEQWYAARFSYTNSVSGYIMQSGGAHAVQSRDGNFPPSNKIVGMTYKQEDFSSSKIKADDTITMDDMITSGNDKKYGNKSANGQFFNDSKRFGGVVEVALPRYSTDTDHSLGGNVYRAYVGFTNVKNGTTWNSIQGFADENKFIDITSADRFNWSPEYSEGDWRSSRFRIGLFDEQIYFDTYSSIKKFKARSINSITLSQFKKIMESNDAAKLSRYVEIELEDTPKAVIRNKESKNESKISAVFDNDARAVKLKLDIPHSFSSNFNWTQDGNIPSWINDKHMISEISINYDDFKKEPTSWIGSKSIALNSLQNADSLISKTLSTVSNDELKALIINNISFFYESAPIDIQLENVEIERKDNKPKGTTKLTVKLNKFYNEAAQIVDDPNKPITGTVEITGFSTVGETGFAGLDLWVWIVIGVSVLVVILILVLVIWLTLRKKKKEEQERNRLRAARQANGQRQLAHNPNGAQRPGPGQRPTRPGGPQQGPRPGGPHPRGPGHPRR